MLSAVLALGVLLCATLAWNLVPATVVEQDAQGRAVRFDAARAHRSEHAWNVTFGLPLPAILYDVEPGLSVRVTGAGFDGPQNEAHLVVTTTLRVNGMVASRETTTLEGGGVILAWTAPDAWDGSLVRMGENVLSFEVLVENRESPEARGEWRVEMTDARVRVSGAP